VSEELVVGVDELLAVDGCQVTSGHFMGESHSIHPSMQARMGMVRLAASFSVDSG
jgi:hypothetical protein